METAILELIDLHEALRAQWGSLEPHQQAAYTRYLESQTQLYQNMDPGNKTFQFCNPANFKVIDQWLQGLLTRNSEFLGGDYQNIAIIAMVLSNWCTDVDDKHNTNQDITPTEDWFYNLATNPIHYHILPNIPDIYFPNPDTDLNPNR